MIFSTSGYQVGAIKYAKEHGIVLIKVFDGKLNYLAKGNSSDSTTIPNWVDIPKYQGEFTYDNSINYLQLRYLDSLDNYLFKK